MLHYAKEVINGVSAFWLMKLASGEGCIGGDNVGSDSGRAGDGRKKLVKVVAVVNHPSGSDHSGGGG